MSRYFNFFTPSPTCSPTILPKKTPCLLCHLGGSFSSKKGKFVKANTHPPGACCPRKLQDASYPASNIWCTARLVRFPNHYFSSQLGNLNNARPTQPVKNDPPVGASQNSKLCITSSARYNLGESSSQWQWQKSLFLAAKKL